MASATADLSDPCWLAHRHEADVDRIRFRLWTREQRAAVPFLTDDHLPDSPAVSVTRDAVRALPGGAPLALLFHSGFCCSTLLVKCFDAPGLSTGLSEPVLLNDATGLYLRGGSQDATGALLTDALYLLGRPLAGDRVVLVKPSCVVNGLAPAIMALQPQARALVLHAPVEDFIASVARKGMDGRLWVRELFLKLRRMGRLQLLGFSDADLLGQTDLQIAALTWLAQQAIFAELIERFGARVASLDSEALLANPETTLAAAGRHWGCPPDTAQHAAMLAGPMQRNSKDNQSFSADQRRADYDGARSAHGDEIAKVAVWARAVADARGITMTLPAALA